MTQVDKVRMREIYSTWVGSFGSPETWLEWIQWEQRHGRYALNILAHSVQPSSFNWDMYIFTMPSIKLAVDLF